MNRRDAIKRMGVLATGAVITSTVPANASSLISENNSLMKILAINGSSRKQGNTGDMIDIVLSELSSQGLQVDRIDFAGHTINPCKACFACAGKRNCVFTDDIFRDVYERMTDADVIIIGSPAYSADVSSTLKAVISDQQSDGLSRDNRRAIPQPMERGTVLQMDQAASANQEVLGTIGECCPHPNILCHNYLLSYSNRAARYEAGAEYL